MYVCKKKKLKKHISRAFRRLLVNKPRYSGQIDTVWCFKKKPSYDYAVGVWSIGTFSLPVKNEIVITFLPLYYLMYTYYVMTKTEHGQSNETRTDDQSAENMEKRNC